MKRGFLLSAGPRDPHKLRGIVRRHLGILQDIYRTHPIFHQTIKRSSWQYPNKTTKQRNKQGRILVNRRGNCYNQSNGRCSDSFAFGMRGRRIMEKNERKMEDGQSAAIGMGNSGGENVLEEYRMTNLATDVPLKNFWKDNEHFAEVFNVCLFGGKEVLKAGRLREIDTEVSASMFSKEFQKTIRRSRDSLKVNESGEVFCILGIENQQSIHYAMPLRTMVYDALTYLQEMEKITAENKKKKALTGPGEFLSGLKKGDKLHPCCTLIVYWGEEKWDAPRTLAELMQFAPDDPIREYFNDYPMHLICVNESDGKLSGDGDVVKLFTAVREIYRNGGEELPTILADVSLEVAYLTTLVTNTTKQYEQILTEAIKMKRERINMCEAARIAFEKKMEEGVSHGRKQEKCVIALKMLKAQKSESEILEFTELTREELAELRKRLG